MTEHNFDIPGFKKIKIGEDYQLTKDLSGPVYTHREAAMVLCQFKTAELYGDDAEYSFTSMPVSKHVKGVSHWYATLNTQFTPGPYHDVQMREMMRVTFSVVDLMLFEG